MALVTYADLIAPAVSDSTKEVGKVCVSRLMSATAPMPPLGSPSPSAADVAAFENWVSAGMPQAACGGTTGGTGSSGGGSGSGSSGGATGSVNGTSGGVTGSSSGTASGASGSTNYNTPSQCSSGKTSKSGDGSTMRPGDGCTSCHNSFLAGTVYATAHEPTLCDGTSVSNATVVITDANGAVTTLPVNNVGNFYTSASIAKPFQAKVLYNGVTRAMVAAQTTGNCNSCHSEQGANGAPGRIVLP